MLLSSRRVVSSHLHWAFGPAALACAAMIAPWLWTHGYRALPFALQHAFSLVCHQRPERCFWIFGAPVAVCARCLGIYLGAVVGLLLQTSRRIAFQLLIAAAALNILDWLTEAVGLHGNWMTVRFVLGLALGVAGGLLVSSSTRHATSDPRDDDGGKAFAVSLTIR